MRGWIMAAPWYRQEREGRGPASESSSTARLELVVLDDVVELVRLLELLAREGDPLADLARALGRPLAQPALELLDAGGDEDRDGAGHLAA